MLFIAKLERIEVDSPQTDLNSEYRRLYKGICTVIQLHFNENACMHAKLPQMGGGQLQLALTLQ